MKKWRRLPPVKQEDVHPGGCLQCPKTHAGAVDLATVIAVGFGSAVLTKDGATVYDGEAALQAGREPKTIKWAEKQAAKDPDHDWQVRLHAPLRGRTYQRHGAKQWILVQSDQGFDQGFA